MYSLFDETSTTPKIKPVSSFADFYKLFIKEYATKKKVPSMPDTECSICASHKADVVRIYRSCKVSPYPCEGHECSCYKSIPISTTPSTKTATTTTTTLTTATPTTPTTPTTPELPVLPVCAHCLVNFLYTKTNDHMKKNGRWRACCPFCKAEFCHLDVIIYQIAKAPR